MDARNMKEIDLCDAAFGTEYTVIGMNRSFQRRNNNGFFNIELYKEKVA